MGSSIFQRPKWSRGFCRGVVQITLQNLFRGGFGLVSMARDIFCGVACMGWGVGAAFSVLLLFACVGPLLCPCLLASGLAAGAGVLFVGGSTGC